MRPENSPLDEAPAASGDASTIGASDREPAESPSPASHRAPRVGRLASGLRLSNRYRIVSPLGSGGMGEVYEALDEQTSRTVALKCLPRLEPESLLLFKREFRLLADLYHPNLARLGELASDDDLWFFTMERVHGEDFISYARRGGEGALRGALRQLGEALTALHREGRVHRDIKPHNVLVEPSGRVVVLDFGLVHDAGGADATKSVAGAIRGTPLYMAPEQAAGKLAGPAADYYAVGAMLYEALVGRPPFEGSLLAVLVDKQMKIPTAPARLAPNVPADLDALCLALLRSDAAERAGAAELASLSMTTTSTTSASTTTTIATPSTTQSAPARSANRPGMDGAFVGRHVELEALQNAFADSATRAVTVVLEGESGVGKSALARKLAVDARANGALVLAGRCFDREHVPYKILDGVVDSLARQLARMPTDQVAAWVPRQREAAAMLETFPVLRTVKAFDRVLPPVAALDPAEHRRMLFSALRELLERLGTERRIVIVVDDLQWADPDSHVALAELLVAVDAPPVLWVFTMRPGAFERFELPGDVRRTHIAALEPADALALAKALGCTGDAIGAVARESGGHPMFLREMSIRANDEGPQLSLDDSIAKRVAELDADSRALVEVVVVAGCPLPVDLALRAAGLRDEPAGRAVALTRAENLLRAGDQSDDATIEPYHDRVRETVVTRLGPGRTMERRGALAKALAGSALAERRPDLEAAHLRASGDLAGASAAYVRAGRLAARGTAFDAAASSFGEALSLGLDERNQRAAVLEELGDALANAGRPLEATEALLEAAATGQPEDAVRRRRTAGVAMLDSGEPERAREILEPVLAMGGESWPRQTLWFLARLLFEFVRMPWYRLRTERVRLDASDALHAATADLMMDIAMRLALTDHMVAAWFSCRAAGSALRARDPGVLGRVASWQRAVTAGVGRYDPRWDAVAARCEAAVGASDLSAARRVFSDQFVEFFDGSLHASIASGLRFEELAGRIPTRQLAPEKLMGHMFMFWGSWMIERFDSAAMVRAAAREASRRRDPLAAMVLGEQCYGAWVVNADLHGLRDVCRIGAEMVEVNPISVRNVQRMKPRLMLNLVDGTVELDAEQTTVQSLIRSALAWTMSSLMSIPALPYFGVVGAMLHGSGTARWIRSARSVVRRFGWSSNVMVRLSVGESRIAVAIGEGDRATILEALRSSVAIARGATFHGFLAINSHRLGRFLGGAEGEAMTADAEQTLRAAGARDPRLLAMLAAPLPTDDFGPYRVQSRDTHAEGFDPARSEVGVG